MSFLGQFNFGYPVISQNLIKTIPDNAVLPLSIGSSLKGNILGTTFGDLKSQISGKIGIYDWWGNPPIETKALQFTGPEWSINGCSMYDSTPGACVQLSLKTINGYNIKGNGAINLTKSNVGLSNVDNTSDLNKPVSTATQTALNTKLSLVTYANIIYVDTTNGNDSTGLKNRLDKPYLNYSAAKDAATAGDIIYMRKGSYSNTAYQLKDLVDVYCEPGVILLGGFTDSGVAVNAKIYGYGNFGNSSQAALLITGDGSNIYFEFDRIDGTRNNGIFIDHNGACTLNAIGNIIRCSTPFRTRTGTKNISLIVKQLISSYNQYAIRLGSSSSSPMIGSISIDCPIIEVTGSAFARAAVYFDVFLSNIAGSDYSILIKSDVIRMTNLTLTESRPNIVSSCIWRDGGDNITINANLKGNACLGVCNRGGATPAYGSLVINGNVSSNIECISSNQKYSNGNGWANVIFKNGLIKSAGLGSSGSVVESGNTWNSIFGGVAGDIQFINCVLYNAATDGKIVQHDLPNNSTNKNIYFYNCIAYTEGTGGYFASSVQASKQIGLHNVRANKTNDSMITDPFTPTGFIADTNLIIPKK